MLAAANEWSCRIKQLQAGTLLLSLPSIQTSTTFFSIYFYIIILLASNTLPTRYHGCHGPQGLMVVAATLLLLDEPWLENFLQIKQLCRQLEISPCLAGKGLPAAFFFFYVSRQIEISPCLENNVLGSRLAQASLLLILIIKHQWWLTCSFHICWLDDAITVQLISFQPICRLFLLNPVSNQINFKTHNICMLVRWKINLV